MTRLGVPLLSLGFVLLQLPALPAPSSPAGELRIQRVDRVGTIQWTNRFTNGAWTLITAPEATGPWTPVQQAYITNRLTRLRVNPSEHPFVRVLNVDLSSNSPNALTNLVQSYGAIDTMAGNGWVGSDFVNGWNPVFEGGPATAATLSRPHFAMADRGGNVFIVDKNSHSLLKVRPDGTIVTVAGTHAAGNGPDSSTPGTQVALQYPNGLWVRGDGTAYILDTDNAKIRRLDTNGHLRTIYSHSGTIGGGRGLWVKDDETIIYFVDGSNVKRRSNGNTTKMNTTEFSDPGNLVVNPKGELIVTDRGASRVYRINSNGSLTVIAGDGSSTSPVDGAPILATGLAGVRAIWYLPNGGYLLGLHEGASVVYVDTRGIVHRFVDGLSGNTHAGDGDWFYTPGPKIGEVRSVTMDYRGDLLICENDRGYIRRIPFLRLWP